MNNNSFSQRGFTLIELLVALALMAMIATILITSLHVGGHTWQRVTRQASSTDDIAQAQAFIRHTLSSLYPHDGRGSDTVRPVFLISDGVSIEFTSDAPEALAGGALRYRIAVVPDSGMLEVRSRRDHDGVPGSSTSDWVLERLLPRVSSFTVRFWLEDQDLPGHWLDRWVNRTDIPQLIRIDVAFAPDDNRRWPTLYIEPRVDTPVSCQFDVVSRRCRSNT
jgi:prepilin-type N-terminal cleavage/methylation domain-containing protein